MSEDGFEPAISSQLAEVAMKYWFEESRNPANCSSVCKSILNEAVANEVVPFRKRLSDIQKGLVFSTSAVLEIADELILAQNENRSPNLKKVMGHIVDSGTLMGRAHKQISAGRKEQLNPVLNKDIEKLCHKDT